MFLESAVLAATVSGIISYLIARRNDRLHYITDERKNWRNEIREISKKLQGASYKRTVHILTEIKVRINAFGANGCSKHYRDDAHIWEVVSEIEKNKCEKESLKHRQNQLIEYLALLLKDDWERSKREVNGDKYSFLGTLFFLMAGICFCGVVYYHMSHTSQFSVYIRIIYILVCILCMALLIVIIPNESEQIGEQLLGGVIRDEVFPRKIGWLALSYVICVISLLFLICLNCGILSRLFDLISAPKDVGFLGIILLLLFGCGFRYIEQTGNLERKYFYYRAISIIRGKYKGQEEQSEVNSKKY